MASVRLCGVLLALLLPSTAAAVSLTPSSAGATTGLIQGAVPNATDISPTALTNDFATPTGTSPTLGTDYLPAGGGWDGMDGKVNSLNYLSVWAGSGDQLVLGVPIIPKTLGLPSGSLHNGALGNYNKYFTQLAQTLIGLGLGNAWLRLGWEFDNNAYPWKADTTTLEGYFATYFQNIVTTMKAVSGANFKYIWNPDGYAFDGGKEDPIGGHSNYDVSLAWPGASYVDFIGIDQYDQAPATGYTPTEMWNWIDPLLNSTTPGALGAGPFAAQYGIPLAFCEWGVVSVPAAYGLGDDPLYINNMYAFMSNSTNNVAFESYFNVSKGGFDSEITEGYPSSETFPNSLSAFTADFG